MKTKIILALIALALIGAGSLYWNLKKEMDPGPGFAGGNGRLEATEIDISAKLAGRIISIKVDEGDFVKAGNILAVMETAVLEAQLNEAKADVFKAKAAAASARSQVEVKKSEVVAAKATVAQRQSELDQMQRRFKRTSVLANQGVLTEQDYDVDETNEMAAKAAVETAKAQVGVAESTVKAAQAEASGAEASVRAAEATVARIEADIRDSHLAAPCDGRVQYRIAQPGEVLSAGGKVLNYIDLSDVYINFFLPSEQAGRVAIGAETRIILDAAKKYPIPAKVSYVASQAQFTPKTVETESERQKLMFRVKAKVDRELLKEFMQLTKTGLPGVAWVKIDPEAKWPSYLEVKQVQVDSILPEAPKTSTETAPSNVTAASPELGGKPSDQGTPSIPVPSNPPASSNPIPPSAPTPGNPPTLSEPTR